MGKQNMNKRILIATLGLALAASACGGGSSSSSAATANQYDGCSNEGDVAQTPMECRCSASPTPSVS